MHLLRFFGIAITAFFIYVNLQYWHFFWLGFIMLPLFLWLASEGIEGVLIKFFNFSPGARAKLIAIFFVLSIFGILCGALSVFWKLDALGLGLIMILIGAVSVFMPSVDTTATPKLDSGNDDVLVLTERKYYWLAFVALVAFGLFSLWRVRASGPAITPWQIIPSNFVYIIFLSMLTLGGLIFSKLKTNLILFFIGLQFVLCLSYLPLTHKLFWGADGWRHIAVMEQITAGQPLQIVNYAANPTWLEKINPGQFAYSQFWGVGSALQKILQVDFVYIVAWLQPVLASVMLPILLFEFGLVFNLTRRKSALLAWFGLWPFALQMAGAFSLPVNFGFLFFLAIFLLILRRSASPNKKQIWLLSVLLVLSVFSYTLFTILFAVFWAMSELLLRAQTSEKFKNNFILPGILLVGAIFIPAIELISGYANFARLNAMWAGIKQLAGNFFGYYLASGPRTHIIETGNIFFNQTPLYAFISNGFTVWRWWIPVIMLFVLAGIIVGVIKLFKSIDARFRLLAVAGLSVFSGYIISRYLLSGEHLLSRRLEAVVAFFAVLIIFLALQKVFEKSQFVSLLLVLAVSGVTAASFSLGPVSRAMSADEYGSAKIVWQKIQNEDKPCVVADVYPLLALEALSRKQVVGGGFPIDKNFGQPELTGLLKQFMENPAPELWREALNLTGAKSCYFITPVEAVPLTSTSTEKFGNTFIYSNF